MPIPFPSAQSIDQKSGHPAHRKIKAGQHHTKHTQSQQGIFAGAAVPVISDQRQQEEWQIADKHNLHGGMEYDRPRMIMMRDAKKLSSSRKSSLRSHR